MYRYTLDTGTTKFKCPQCGHNRFVRYVDTKTRQYMPEQYGRCDREESCGYHATPYADDNFKTQQPPGYSRAVYRAKREAQKQRQAREKSVTIPADVFSSTLSEPLNNAFAYNLTSNIEYPLPVPDVRDVFDLYQVGTFRQATTFPFIDIRGRVQAVQMKYFDDSNHTTKTSFLHAYFKNSAWYDGYSKREKKITCLFGEHLLRQYPDADICLVEAPKTAIVGTLYYGTPCRNRPLFLAVYNLSSLTPDKLGVLKGRDVELIPDTAIDGAAYKAWQSKVREFQRLFRTTSFHVSDVLEKQATDAEKAAGYDLADFLVRQKWQSYRDTVPEPEPYDYYATLPEPVTTTVAEPVTEPVTTTVTEPEIADDTDITDSTPLPIIAKFIGYSMQRLRKAKINNHVVRKRFGEIQAYILERNIA